MLGDAVAIEIDPVISAAIILNSDTTLAILQQSSADDTIHNGQQKTNPNRADSTDPSPIRPRRKACSRKADQGIRENHQSRATHTHGRSLKQRS
jgi:hypothetical protein